MMQLEEQTLKMVQELLSIPDIEMRALVLAERLKEHSAEETAEILQIICQRAIERDEKCKEMLLSLVDFNIIVRELGNAKLGQIYMIAQEKHFYPVVRLLSRPPSQKRLKKRKNEQLSDSLFDDVPLGARRFLAKKGDKAMLARLLKDPSPMVIRNLLKNPRITEQDVIRIASKRPNAPEVLEEISLSKKWIVRYSIKIAIVRNPYTAPALAIKLLHFLMRQDLKEVCEDTFLHPQVIEAAKSLLEKNNELKYND